MHLCVHLTIASLLLECKLLEGRDLAGLFSPGFLWGLEQPH